MAEDLSKIAILGNYLPRRCGIATFTTDLCDGLAGQMPSALLSVAAMNDTREGYKYPARVRFQIAQNRISEYRNAADFLNISNYEVTCVQHEFGIYGGPAGGLVLSFMRELRMPVVTTLHTVLENPDANQKAVTEELVELSNRIVVMNHRGAEILAEQYGAGDEKVGFIHHGVADMPFVDPNFYKDLFGVEGKKVLLTFGLLSPNKGIEYMIRALPDVVKKHPDIVYMVVGVTHPNVVRQKGEEYRFFLQGLVRSLDLEGFVIFHDRFVELDELKAFIGSADICVTPYLSEAQMTSGVLSLCVGAGRATVSTPYWYAKEMLADNRGMIVPFADSGSLAEAVLYLLDNDVERHAMRKRAYVFGRDMIWSAVATRYIEVYEQALEGRRGVPRRVQRVSADSDKLRERMPALKFDHLKRMTDSTGIMQHAKYTIPDRTHGYCTDDNARALVVAVRAAGLLNEEAAELNALATTYLSFLDYALIGESGRFHNFMAYDRRWRDKVGSEDSHGRALWGLGAAATYGTQTGFIGVATHLFNAALPCVVDFVSPRAVALSLIGIHEYLRRFSGDMQAHRIRERLALSLFERFREHSKKDWPWPEEALTYINARLPQALLLAGQWMNKPDMIETALKALAFLMKVQKSPQGSFEPVGYKGWYKRGGKKARFDQQPIEAESALGACVGAWRVTRDERWLEQARICHEWFLGRNDLGESLYDHVSGGCKDGLQADGVNQNQGAESTLAWLLSAVTMEEVRVEAPTRKEEKVTAVTDPS